MLYVSTHQDPLYPGTGQVTDTGGPEAPGLTINYPRPPGNDRRCGAGALDTVVAPAVDAFAPTWILVSAGFDAHRDDPLAGLCLSSGDFGALAGTVAQFAPGPGRLALFLEGGYDLDALRASVATTVAVLVGAHVESEPQTGGGLGREALDRARRAQPSLALSGSWAVCGSACSAISRSRGTKRPASVTAGPAQY